MKPKPALRVASRRMSFESRDVGARHENRQDASDDVSARASEIGGGVIKSRLISRSNCALVIGMKGLMPSTMDFFTLSDPIRFG